MGVAWPHWSCVNILTLILPSHGEHTIEMLHRLFAQPCNAVLYVRWHGPAGPLKVGSVHLASPDVVLVLGAPGAGKGTQARFLAQMLGVPQIASGDLLREHRQRGTELGRAAQVHMDRGDLVPDELVTTMIDGFERAVNAAGDRSQWSKR